MIEKHILDKFNDLIISYLNEKTDLRNKIIREICWAISNITGSESQIFSNIVLNHNQLLTSLQILMKSNNTISKVFSVYLFNINS